MVSSRKRLDNHVVPNVLSAAEQEVISEKANPQARGSLFPRMGEGLGENNNQKLRNHDKGGRKGND